MWNGAIANLKNKLIRIKNKPKLIIDTSNNVSFEKFPWQTWNNKLLKSSKLIVPVKPYNNDEPNKNKLEEKA